MSGTASGKSTVSATARVKYNFSKQHLQGAEFFAQQARNLESSVQAVTDNHQSQHRAYVTSAILSSVAFLEASINELYYSACNKDLTALPNFDLHMFDLFAQFWEDVETYPILNKYQVALALAGKSRFDPGGSPYQEAESLVKLRDCLVHYKPEWDDERGRHQKLESRLKGKFPLNPLVAKAALWFPHRCLSAGCAAWSAETARKFSDEFCSRLAIPLRSR